MTSKGNEQQVGGRVFPAPYDLNVDLIERLSIPEPNSGCWLWLGAADEQGYGQLKVRGARYRAPRASWIVHRGPIGPGLSVCHRCDTPACVNPDHLFLGTVAENQADKMAKGRHWAPRLCGLDNPKGRLSDADVLEIRASPLSHREAAAHFGVSYHTIRDIRRLKARADVTASKGSAVCPVCQEDRCGMSHGRVCRNVKCPEWKRTHEPNCGYHLDQYPWECTCRK